MSLRLVDDEHIRVMIWAGLRPAPEGPLTWAVETPDGNRRYQLNEENAARVGEMLHDQNIAAYKERYGDDEYGDGLDGDDELAPRQPEYFHSTPQSVDLTPIDLFKVVEYYVYNSFHGEDHDEASTVEALMFCGALARRLGPALPGWGDPSFPSALVNTPEWESSPWGINARPEADVADKPRQKRSNVTADARPASSETAVTAPATSQSVAAKHGGSSSARPHGPVPWMLTGADGAWVWDPGHGLVQLTDPFSDGRNIRGWQLSADGAQVAYHASPRGLDTSPTEFRRLELVSGKIAVEPDPPAGTHVFRGATGLEARVAVAQLDIYDYTAKVTIERDGDVRELPHRFGVGLSTNLTGDSIQFSSDRRWVALGFGWSSNPFGRLGLFDLDSSRNSALWHYGLELAGSGAVSPDGLKLLVRRTEQRTTIVTELCVFRTSLRKVDLVPQRPEHRGQAIEHVGWIDNEHLLVYISEKRRVSMRSVDIETGDQVELAAFGLPMHWRDFHGLRMAPIAVQADPTTLLGPVE